MSRFAPLLVLAISAGALALGAVSAPHASSTSPAIDNIASFLEQCPTNDPMYSQIRSDFEIRREGVVVGDINCSEPVSAMPVAQYTDEVIVAQALRTIYYMDGGRELPYPWTSGSLYDWMKSKIGGVDISANGSYCCTQYNGKWYVVINSQNTWDRDFARQWQGISYRITVLAHETRHVDGYPHVGYCPLFPDQPYGCDQTYDESDLSPYGIEWWLNAKWLSGEIYVGFSCAASSVVTSIANWHLQQANHEYGGRFVDNSPPTLTMPAQPGGPCQSSGQTPIPRPTASPTPSPTHTPSPTPSPSPTQTPSPTLTPSPTPTPTPTSTPTQPATPPPTVTPTPSETLSPPSESVTPAPTDIPTTSAPTPSPTPSATPTASSLPPPQGSTATPMPSPTPSPLISARANANCDGTTDTSDVALMLKAALGLDYRQPAGCAAPGQPGAGFTAGDVDCSGTFDLLDVLALLRYLGGMSAGDCSARSSSP
jgi:hypothetical protein